MALRDKKSKPLYKTGSANASDPFFLNAGSEASASASYARGTHIKEPTTRMNLAPIMYQLKLIDEDIEEIRRFNTGSGEIDVDGGSF
tara:strand:+ start:760 stop:1020 length:261 start_codon:yes stop_codon:yes gene_type:complete